MRTRFPRLASWAFAGTFSLLALAPAAEAAGYAFTVLPPLAQGEFTRARQIANSGWIVGNAGVETGGSHAVVWQGGVLVDAGAAEPGSSAAYGLNEAGTLVGYGDAFNDSVGMVWANGARTLLTALNGVGSRAEDINNQGQIVGASDYAVAVSRATLWASSTSAPVELSTLGGNESDALAINDAGVAVGWSITATGYTHATRWVGTTPSDLGTLPGGTFSQALAVNEAGQIVGTSTRDGQINVHATLWQDGVVIDLGTLGGDISQASAINGTGTIVGWSLTSAALNSHATIWTNGQLADLNLLVDPKVLTLGWRLRSATGINDSGVIIGEAYNRFSEQTRMFVLTPKP